MDALQIQHAISQIEIYSEQLKKHLTSGTVDRIEELEYQVKSAEDELSNSEDENDSLRESIKECKEILKTLLVAPNNIEKIKEAINCL
jgi:Mg2+ and Co2+ transporter CorA